MADKDSVNIVWLKRDLRTQDHAPLHAAEKDGLPYIIVYIFEPSIIHYPDTSLRHLQFQYSSIMEMNKKLESVDRCVDVIYSEAIDFFENVQLNYTIKNVFSYCESGIKKTFDRDKLLKKYFARYKINWHEFQRDGIIRGIKNRTNWDKKWHQAMHEAITINTYSST